MTDERTLADRRREESRRFLERNSDAIRRAYWSMKAEQSLMAHRAEQGRRS